MRIDASGNVGIGTTSPGAKLDVTGTHSTQFTGNDIIFKRAGSAYINASDANGRLAFQTGSTTRMYINTSGNIGIGTTSPARKLQVESAQQIVSTFKSSSTTAGFITLMDATTTSDSNVRFGAIGNNLVLYTSAERMRIDASGNVGIGTTAPAQKLHVPNKIRLDATTTYSTTGANLAADPSNPILGPSADENQAILGEPSEWLLINIGGTDFAIPAYAV